MKRRSQTSPADFFGTPLKANDVILYSTGTKPHEQGFAYGVILECKEFSSGSWSCYISPIINGNISKYKRWREAENVLKCPEEHIPDYNVSISEIQ